MNNEIAVVSNTSTGLVYYRGSRHTAYAAALNMRGAVTLRVGEKSLYFVDGLEVRGTEVAS